MKKLVALVLVLVLALGTLPAALAETKYDLTIMKDWSLSASDIMDTSSSR